MTPPPTNETSRDDSLHQLRRAHHHEIRGALNALRLQLTLLQRGREKTTPDDPRFGQWVDGAAAEADAVEKALEELSAVEKINEFVGSDDPSKIAERVTRLLEPFAKTKRARLSVEVSVDAADGTSARATNPGRLAAHLLHHGAAALAAADSDETLTFRIGDDGIDVSPGSIHFPYDQA